MRPAHADSFLAFPPLFIFAESSPTHNRGDILFTEDPISCFAVGIMDRGLEDSARECKYCVGCSSCGVFDIVAPWT